MNDKTAVGILGCTGSVGQRFVELLADHPWFEVTHLGASPYSAGKQYAAVGKWKLPTPLDARIGALTVTTCDPEHFNGCKVVFSGLDSSVAGEVESAFASAGFAVFSNARNHRMDPLVPLMVPTVNPSHIGLVDAQRKARGVGTDGGFIVTNANCSTTGLVVPLAALHREFGIDKCMVFTMQAVSGAGYPGLSVMDMTDNVLPLISGEEDKLENEPRKILGSLANDGSKIIEAEGMTLSAICNRVNVIDGHTECVSIKFAGDKKPSVKEIEDCLRAYGNPLAGYNIPSDPKTCLVVHDAPDRPQPRMDRGLGGGYTVSVGRVRECPILDVKFTLLSHNTIIGAAGSGLLNAELARAMKYI